MSGQWSEAEYGVFGVLCAAKHETGTSGARRLFRIQMRLSRYTDNEVEEALRSLLDRGVVRQLPEVVGMFHYEALPLAAGEADH